MENKQASYNSSLILSAAAILQQECHARAANSGWWLDEETGEDVRTWPPKFFRLWVVTKLMLAVTEIAEGVEGYRKDLMDQHLPHRKSVEVEAADAIIRLFDLVGGMGLDVPGAIVEKLEFNAQRADHKIENRAENGGKKF